MEPKLEGFIKKNTLTWLKQRNVLSSDTKTSGYSCFVPGLGNKTTFCFFLSLFKDESFNQQHFGWIYRVFLVKPAWRGSWVSSGPSGDTELVSLLYDGWSFCPRAASFDYILLTDAAPPRTNAAFSGPAGSVAPPSDGNECPLVLQQEQQTFVSPPPVRKPLCRQITAPTSPFFYRESERVTFL